MPTAPTMKRLDLAHPPGELWRNQRPVAAPGSRCVRGIDVQAHDRLAEEVLKMRYLSRLRAFLAADAHP